MISGTPNKARIMPVRTKDKHSSFYRFLLISVMFMLGLCFFSKAFAGQDLIINADMQFNFADQYFFNKDYSRAISEYNRFVYFFPEDKRAGLARYRIGMSVKCCYLLSA